MVATAAQEVQCPCCDNPWARATGDWFAKLCQECDETTMDRGVGLSRSNVDFDGEWNDVEHLCIEGGHRSIVGSNSSSRNSSPLVFSLDLR